MTAASGEIALCCRFAPDASAVTQGAEVCPCGHLITPGYRCHGCGSTRLSRARARGC
jgi:hypothetical protein